MLNPDIHNSARRFLDSREPKHRRQIVAKIVALCQDPEPPDSQPLKGADKGQRRATVGEYRIVYRVIVTAGAISPDILNVTGIGKRNDDEVYRRRKQK
jgi:mRNA interferase RelE/StbE